MTHTDALARVADDPHAWRYRQLCDEGNPDVEQRDAYRLLVIRLAQGAPNAVPAEKRPSVAESLALTRATSACPYRSSEAKCGCSGARCSLRGGAKVAHPECFECIRRYG